ncbi:SDR family oxidoreductase [Kistimonas asteriae]|uniref:SDR family oxidoreductase n=1 Tax=Kistimonas asteriae TaxID=517724 RepID=UPI001BABB4D3|nr:SDR family oxidoreductase [Kistimonas asteriae]
MTSEKVTPLETHYFVTGATGFLGTHLLERLLARRGQVHILVRDRNEAATQNLLERYRGEQGRIHVYEGDITRPMLGLQDETLDSLRMLDIEFFHLAAIYDIEASMELQRTVNVDGTRHALDCAAAIGARGFHLTSSIAVAGLYKGVFDESMLDEAGPLNNAYLQTKHDSEQLVRRESRMPWRIYRPGMVVGHSVTGEISKVDGPYYLFNAIRKLRDSVPEWMPLVGLEGGQLNLVPVDYVADVIDHIAHQSGCENRCFHVTDPNPRRLGELVNLFAETARAPKMSMRIDAANFNPLVTMFAKSVTGMPSVQRFTDMLLKDLGIPRETLSFLEYPTRFDRTNTDQALEGSGIRLKSPEEYVRVMWSYWEQHLDEERMEPENLIRQVKGKVVMITGASSGIGRTTALRLAESGARLLLVARDQEALEAVASEIHDAGGNAFACSADLTSDDNVEQLAERVIREHGGVDILINNAGRSIRRGVEYSYDRLHDFQRTMEINYFGALRLMLAFLPGMVERGGGQVINISSIAVLTSNPRFSAYTASKSALDSFTRSAASEYADKGVKFTTINMPLVKTPMIAPTKLYNHVPTLTPEQAAELIVKAIIQKPARIATRLGMFSALLNDLLPGVSRLLMNTGYHMFPESAASQGKSDGGEQKPSPEQKLMVNLLKGVNW